MHLYHYTSVLLFEILVASGGISKGHFLRSNGTLIEPVVWLTSAATHENQGLDIPINQLLSSQRAYFEKEIGQDIQLLNNRDQIRIEVAIDESEKNLQRFSHYCANSEPPLYGKKYGLFAARDLQNLSPREQRSLMFTDKSHEENWWLYFDVIPPENFLNVDYKTVAGYVPYMFQKGSI